MTAWTMDQVWAVRRLWVEGEVSEELAMLPAAREAIHHDHAHHLAAEARVHAVEVHPDDVRISIGERESRTFRRATRGWWEPQTEELELLGGYRDGETFHFPGVRRGDPFRTPVVVAPTYAAFDAPLTPTATFTVDVWVPHGWNEEARRWVYGPA